VRKPVQFCGCSTVVEIPGLVIVLFRPLRFHRMVDDGVGSVQEPFLGMDQPPAEFGVFADPEIRAGSSQVDPKKAILFEGRFSKGHVRPEGGSFDLASVVAEVETGNGFHKSMRPVCVEPRRFPAGPDGDDLPGDADTVLGIERGLQMAEPIGIDRNIVVGEGKDLTPRLLDPEIAGMGKALTAFKNISDIKPGDHRKVLNHLPCIIDTIIVYHN